jgi:hypothetical protein
MAVTLLPHQTPITGISKDFVFGIPGASKSRIESAFKDLIILDQTDSVDPEPMTKEERNAVNRGIDDMINERIANEGRVAEVYAKLKGK